MAENTSTVSVSVDITDLLARQEEIQTAREEITWNIRKLEESERELAIEAVNLQILIDAEAKRKEEKEDKIAFLKKKQEILEYKFGDKLSLKTFEAEGIDVSDMKRVTIALFGHCGAGRTSFIGTVERTLLGPEKQTAFGEGPGQEGTIRLEEYLSALNFRLLDTRGIWKCDDDQLAECQNIMTGKVRKGEIIERNWREHHEGLISKVAARSMAKLGDQAHAVIFLIEADDSRLKDGDYWHEMETIREHFRLEGHSPITVITHEDKMNDEKKEIILQEASAATGSPIGRTFFITNYTNENNEYSLKTEKQVLDILDTALLSAERFVKIQKLQEAHHGNTADH